MNISVRPRAVRHDDVRPAWSEEVISWLLGSPAERLEVLDLGAGTGLGNRPIAALGHQVTAVDTAEDMLSTLAEACRLLPPEVAERISTAIGSAESIPLRDRSVDAITCLQAWQWVDPVEAMAECDRVLRPHGSIGLAWHTWDRTSEWVKALANIVEPHGAPADQTRTVPGDFAGRGPFERKEFPLAYKLPVNRLVELARSWTFVSQRPDAQSVIAEIGRLGQQASSPTTGLLTFPHITVAFRHHGKKAGAG